MGGYRMPAPQRAEGNAGKPHPLLRRFAGGVRETIAAQECEAMIDTSAA